MKIFSLIALLILSIASNAFAADSAVNSKIQNQDKNLSNSTLQKKEQFASAKKLKEAAYELHIVGNIKANARGKREYTVALHNQSKSKNIAPNTLDIVVVRKYAGGETLLGTHPVTSELKTYGVVGNNFVIKSELPFCCSTPEHEVRVRLKGTNTVLATTTMHAGSLKTLTIVNHKITNNGSTFSVKINQRGSEYREAIIKATVNRKGKSVDLGQHEILIPPGDSAFSLLCGKVNEREILVVTAYSKTTCSNDTPEQCRMGQSQGTWIRE